MKGKKDKRRGQTQLIESWKAKLLERRQEWNDHLFHVREQALKVGAPTTLAAQVQRVVELNGGKEALEGSPPPHLSFRDCLHKHPRSTLELSGLRINAWFGTLAARTVPPGIPVKPSVCTELRLRGSDITDAGLKNISKLKFIQVLDISGCEVLTDASLTQIRRTLSQLVELHMNECRNFSTAVIVQTWVDCTRLRQLYAVGCHGITDRVLQCIAITKRLPGNEAQCIDVRRCRHVTDSGIADLANSKTGMQLRLLAFGHCLHVKAMAFFPFESSMSLANLQTLEIASIDVDETSISWLTTGCPALTKLNLSLCTKLNDFCCLLLARCRCLRWLSLKGCAAITSTGIRQLLVPDSAELASSDRASALEYLNLKNCVRLDDQAMTAIAQACLDLLQLNLRGIPHITDTGLTAIAKRCTILRTLKLSGCRNPEFYGRPDIGDGGLIALGKLCRRLQVLDLAGCSRVTIRGISAIASTCSSLQSIKLNDTGVDDMAVLALAAHCSQLQTLEMSKCKGITDTAIEYIANGLFQLKMLDLSYCTQLTNHALEVLAASKMPLESLDMTGNERITDDGILVLCRGCQNLRHIQLKGCDRLTETAIRQVAHTLPFGSIPETNGRIQHIACASTQWLGIVGHLLTQYDAAVRLQSAVRKWKRRDATLQAMARRKWLRDRRAAIKIQKAYRRRLEWLSFLHMLSLGRNLDVILHVQAVYRGNKSRVKTRAWKKLANASATIIQRGVKHHLYRRHGYAREIQRVYRGFLGRKATNKRRLEKRRLAGEKIVTWYRRCIARYEFHERAKVISAKVRLIQRVYRAYSRLVRFRRLAQRLVECATLIQSVVRMTLAKNFVERRRILFNDRARRIQSVYRGYRVRKWYQRYKMHALKAVVRLQAWQRGHVRRRWYKRVRMCVVAAQRRFRTYIAIREMEKLVWRAMEFRRLEAIKLIQRVWRGYKGRRRALLFRKIQRAKFARKGQNTAQYWIRRRLMRRGAVIAIQRWIRPILYRSRMIPIHRWRVRQAQLCIQRYVRGWLVRIRAAREKARILAATIDIQRVFRGHEGRSKVRAIVVARRRLHAAILVQSIIRGFLSRCYRRRYFKESSAAALHIQRVYRGKLGRRLAEIERANRTLAARDKYRASLLGKLDLKLDMRERKFFLQRQIEVMKVSYAQLKRRRVGYEKKMVSVRQDRARLWARTNEVVHETYKLKRNLVGASENVYHTKIELDADLARRAELVSELQKTHVSLTRFKQAIQDKIHEVRVMDPVEFWAIAQATGIFDNLPRPATSAS